MRFHARGQKYTIFSRLSRMMLEALRFWLQLASCVEGVIGSRVRAICRAPETQQNARPFGSSMAESQRFGCLHTWPCNCKQTPPLRFPIEALASIY